MSDSPSGLQQGRRFVHEWRHFLVAASILLIAAIGWNAALAKLGVVLSKKYVPLHKPLEDTPEKLGRFELAGNNQIPGAPNGKIKLTEDVEEVLGTDKYITWIYRDTGRTAAQQPVFVRLHVAYYTQLLDAVPHVPDVCQLAGGMQVAEAAREVVWALPGMKPPWQEIKVHRSAFTSGKDRDEPPAIIYYVFDVNGKPMSDRLEVRTELMSPLHKYCYYAKIEFSAFGARLTPEENEEICKAFFASAAPRILEMMASADEIKQMEKSN